MNREEVLDHRKNKFLKIGRNKGFSNQLDDINSLSIQKNKINIYIGGLLNKKNTLFIGSSILLILLVIYFL
jgi:acetyl-CoA carboxylase carboxyl transferase subunit alpha